MNIQKLSLSILLSIPFGSITCMDLPSVPLDFKKFNDDKHQIVSATEVISEQFGNKKINFATKDARIKFLRQFLGTWAELSCSGFLKYNFDSYMQHAEINTDWMEAVHAEKLKKDTITVEEFVPLIQERFNANLAKFEPSETK